MEKNCVIFRKRKAGSRGAANRRLKIVDDTVDVEKVEFEEKSALDNEQTDVDSVVVKKVRDNKLGSSMLSDTSSSNSHHQKSSQHLSNSYTSEESRFIKNDSGATSTFQLDTDITKDARSISERADENIKSIENPLQDKVYRGTSSYAKFGAAASDSGTSASSKKVPHKLSVGPQRAPSNVRSTVRWDYAPDICKDYKETGFCGFGDSCKFMHDRSDYKFGWQLEREELQAAAKGGASKRSKNLGGGSDEENYEIHSDGGGVGSEDDDGDGLPFKCIICKDHFKIPVVTKCCHYFCESCALNKFRESPRCFACGKPTGGVFNPAKEIIKKMEASNASNHGAIDDEDIDDSFT